MNRIKAWFLTAAITTQLGLAAWMLSTILTKGLGLAWLGALLAVLILPLRLAMLVARSEARTSSKMPAVIVMTALGTLAATVGPGASVLSAAVGALPLVDTLLYVFWYSRLGRNPSARLEVGQSLPEFSLHDLDGNVVTSSAFVGSPTVFMFYRGNWCPLCMAQIRELAERYRVMEQRGIRVVLISPQPEESTRELAVRVGVSFEFLVDRDAVVARQLGIAHLGGLPVGLEALGYGEDIVFPTVLVTDANGRILFADQTDNYRVRPEPDTFLAIVGAAEASRSASPIKGRVEHLLRRLPCLQP